MAAAPDASRHTHVQSRRHWLAQGGGRIPVGYYDHLKGQRIPFPGPDGSSWCGVLVDVVEAASQVRLVFEDYGPERE